VFAAHGAGRRIENRTGRPHRTIQIQAGTRIVTAADPLPGDLREALDAINRAG
jgi:hypothetical protein